MSFPDTTASPAFITARPDWSKQILIDRIHDTAIFASRNSTEQRQGRRETSRVSMQYQIQGMNVGESFLREANSLLELRLPVVIPIWPYAITIDSYASPLVTINQTTSDGFPIIQAVPFRSGGFIFTVVNGVDTFYELNSIPNSTTLSIDPEAELEDGSVIWPCCLGYRKNGAAFTTRFTETSEAMVFEEL